MAENDQIASIVKPFNTLVIGMTSRPGAGTSSFTRRAHDQYVADIAPGLSQFRAIQPITMHYLLKRAGYQPTSDTYSVNPQTLREFHRNSFINGTHEAILHPLHKLVSDIVIVEKIRHPQDAAYIQQHGGFILHAMTDEATADSRYISDINDFKFSSAPYSEERMNELTLSKAEMSPASPDDIYSSNILGCIELADDTADFNGSMNDSTKNGLDAVVRLAFRYLDLDQTPQDIAS